MFHSTTLTYYSAWLLGLTSTAGRSRTPAKIIPPQPSLSTYSNSSNSPASVTGSAAPSCRRASSITPVLGRTPHPHPHPPLLELPCPFPLPTHSPETHQSASIVASSRRPDADRTSSSTSRRTDGRWVREDVQPARCLGKVSLKRGEPLLGTCSWGMQRGNGGVHL
ncbi:hypothetical protein C8Q74DRAFT_68572 [Fomes fomentarius]|nr:hypothetical protein C8Q74DRAFT_68572 [Fomes fomentarius]